MEKTPHFSKLFRRFNGLVLLNISGLALGLTSVIFIAVWVGHELSYDRFFKNADRIYRIESLINLSGDPSVKYPSKDKGSSWIPVIISMLLITLLKW